MQNAALAQAFNKSGRALVEAGHRVVVRRARGLLDAGDVEGAVRFLSDAAGRINHAEVRTLSERVRAWQVGGGDARGLVGEGAWADGSAWESHGAEAVAQATQGDLKTLLDSLVAQRRASAAGETIAAPTATASAPTGERAIGSIFGTAERPAAVVEAPARLEERSLDLDDDLATAATVGMMSDAVRAATVTPPPPEGAAELEELEDIDLADLARTGAPPPGAHDRRFGDEDADGPTEAFGFDTDALSEPAAASAPAMSLSKPGADAAASKPAASAAASTPSAPAASVSLGKQPAAPASGAPASEGPAALKAPPSLDPSGAPPGAAPAVQTNRGVLFAVLGLAIAVGAAAAWYFLNN